MIRVGVTGLGFMGKMHSKCYQGLEGATLAAICDVDERLFPKVIEEIKGISGDVPETEVDFRKILDNKDIDVIAIASPDHWHSLQTICVSRPRNLPALIRREWRRLRR